MADESTAATPNTASPGTQRAESFYSTPTSTEDPTSSVPERTNLVEQIDNGGDQQTTQTDDTQTAQTEDTDQQTQTDDTEGDEVRSVRELLDTLEAGDDWFEGLEMERKINGETVSEPLRDILARADKIAAADDYLADAKAKAKEALKEADEQKNLLGENVVVLGTLIQHAEDALKQEFKGTNWDELKRKDPAEWAVKREEIREREDALNNLKTQAAASYRAALENAQETNDKALQDALPDERKVLFEKLPDWPNDIKKAEQESSEVFAYLREQGYNDEQIKLTAHKGRELAMAVKAMRYDKLGEKAVSEEKRVRKIPRILKPGSESTSDPANANDGKKDRAAILYPG